MNETTGSLGLGLLGFSDNLAPLFPRSLSHEVPLVWCRSSYQQNQRDASVVSGRGSKVSGDGVQCERLRF